MEQTQNPENKNQQMQAFPKKEANWAQNNAVDSISKNISEIASSIRILEDRYLNLRKKSQLTDQTLIDLQKEYYKEKKHLNHELIELKIQVKDILDDLKMMKGELQDTAKQKELKVISKYLDFWEPIQFVTRKEVEKLIEKK